MYFFNLDAVKAQLVDGPLPAAGVLPYALGWGVLLVPIAPVMAMVGVQPGGSAALLWSELFLQVLGVVLGTLHVYRCNGGATGAEFLERFLLLGWVVGFRVLVIVIALMLPLSMAEDLGAPDATAPASLTWWWLDPVITILVLLLQYGLTGAAVRDVVRLRSAATTPAGTLPPLPD